MKSFIFSIILIASGITLAKKAVDFKTFNKAVGENISDTIESNPQMYETKPLDRKPASVEQVDPVLKSTDKLDEVVEQADTHTSW